MTVAARRALILGVGGYLGSHLARRLVAEQWEVTGVLRDPDIPHAVTRLTDIRDDVRLVVGDATDPDLLSSIVMEADAIFPFAGHSGAARSIRRPLEDARANALGHLALLEACRTGNPTARVVFPGSRLQYGRVEAIPVVEDHPQRPLSIYAVHKLLGEQYYRLYHELHGLPTTCLRISNPYGPHQGRADRAFGIVGTFFAAAARDETIPLYGGGQQLRDYIYIGDLTELFVLCATVPEAVGQTLNAGGAEATSVRAMAENVLAIVGRGRIVDAPWPNLDALVETGDYVSDISRARRILGWEPQTTLSEGLKLTWKTMSGRLMRL